jgi:hypothetical protein
MAKRYHDSMDLKKQMKKAGSMLSEDMSAPALLPQGVIDRYFPDAGYGMSGGYKDLFGGVQDQLKMDRSGLNKAFSPKKW